MVVPAFGWSAGDLVKLIEISYIIYQAFNDARKNSSRQFQLLSDEFGRFHTCLELLHSLLKKHGKNLYFGHDQFKVTLEECQEFLSKYSVLGDRRNSVAKFFKTIGWTTEERGTINRLITAVHGHAHVIGLYTGYLTLEASLEERAVHEKIIENTQETLNELRRLQRVSSIHSMPFITEEPEDTTAQILGAGCCTDGTVLPKLDEVAKELDGFTYVLKHEQASLDSQQQNSAIEKDLDIPESDEARSIDLDLTMLQTVLQEVEHLLERARNGSKREYNRRFIQQATRRDTHDTHDSGISDMSISPSSRSSVRASPSPTLQPGSVGMVGRSSTMSSIDKFSPILEAGQAPPQHRLSASSMSSPLLGSLSPMIRQATDPSTAVTTPLFASPAWDPDTGTKPPSIRLPAAAIEWSLFCNAAQVTCEGWQRPWSCKISQRRRARDCGLSLRAERADGSYLYHDLPAFEVAVPHTSHSVANPQAKNVVTFKEPPNHRLIKVTHHTESAERQPRYIFQNPTDHKAFQELVYGCDLEDSWDITSVESNREKECVNQTLRLWRDGYTRVPLILFYTNSRRRSPKIYIQEPKTSFEVKFQTEKKNPTVRLSFLDQKLSKKVERASSGSSIGSVARSDRSLRSSTEEAPQLQWIKIEFMALAERERFLSLWQS